MALIHLAVQHCGALHCLSVETRSPGTCEQWPGLMRLQTSVRTAHALRQVSTWRAAGWLFAWASAPSELLSPDTEGLVRPRR